MRFELYEDKSKQWRWRMLARNGRIVAESGEGYTRRANALRAMSTLADFIEREPHKIVHWLRNPDGEGE